MRGGFAHRQAQRQQPFLPVWRDPERSQHRDAHHALCHPHLQMKAVQEDDRVGFVVQVAALPLFEAFLEPAHHTGNRALGEFRTERPFCSTAVVGDDRCSSPRSGFRALRIRRLFAPDKYVPRIASSTSRVRRAYRGNSSLRNSLVSPRFLVPQPGTRNPELARSHRRGHTTQLDAVAIAAALLRTFIGSTPKGLGEFFLNHELDRFQHPLA